MTAHVVVIAGGGPTGLMLAGDLALAGIDVAIVERCTNQDLVGSRAGGLHARTIEILDQRGIADRFLSQGKVAQVASLDSHCDLGAGHPLLGRRMPDLDLVTASSPLRVFTLLHGARPLLLNLAEPGGFHSTPWADRVQQIDATYRGIWELPVLGAVTAPTAALILPDGYVAWVGDSTSLVLHEALTTWFGPPSAA